MFHYAVGNREINSGNEIQVMDTILDALRNLVRRKFRTLPAVLGVAVGVFSFLVMGSMAEHFSRISRQFQVLFANRVFVCERPSFWAGGGILSQAKAEKVGKIAGVKEALPVIISRWADNRMVVVGLPRVIVGVEPDKIEAVTGRFNLSQGAPGLKDGETALLGWDIARENSLSPGDVIKVREKNFTVGGIYEKTGGLLDGQVLIDLSRAQELLNRKGLVTSILVIPAEGVDPEKLAGDIKSGVDGVEVISPVGIQAQIRSSLALWNSLTWGAALAACLAGGLCVVIVMLVSISERVVEIGIKRALGAETGQIMAEFLTEASLLTIAGWAAGSVGALIFSHGAVSWLHSMESNLFDLTGRLFIAGLAGSLILGLAAGLYPAWKASRVNPVEALKVKY